VPISPNNNYRRGADFERKLKRELEVAGAIVAIRAAGSHGKIDVIGVYPDGRVFLIQAKLGKPTKSEREALEELAARVPDNCTVILATPKGKEII
jgi:Holliday junction resolvase